MTIEKLKAGIFDGHQIGKFIKDKNIKEVITDNEAMALEAFTSVVMNFLGNHIRENYVAMGVRTKAPGDNNPRFLAL